MYFRRTACISGGFLAAALMVVGGSGAAAQDVTTAHYDVARTGVQTNESVLTPANVNSVNFGRLFSLPVVGDVYAQPLWLGQYTMSDGLAHNVLFVATQQDYVYAFDADGKNPAQGYLWRRSLLGSGETWVSSNDVGTTDITPNIGITGTPVIDRVSGTLYVVAKSKTTGATPSFLQRLHALKLADGTEKLNGPTVIAATMPGTGDGGSTVAFNPLTNNQRPALLLAATPGAASAASVLIGWSSHGDNGLYHGWVIGYNARDISKQTGAWADTPNGTQGGIWMAAGGFASDGAGNIFAADGNGTFDANSGGKDYGDSAFRLVLGSSGLALADSFTPGDQSSLDAVDNDFGTSALTLLPTQSGATPHLMVTTDKSGTIYLLDRDKMGGYKTPTNSSVQSFNDGGGHIHNSLVFFNNAIYLAADGGPLQAWTFNPATDRFSTTAQSHSGETFGCDGCDGAGSTPSVSAKGTANGIVWALDNSAFGSGPAVLHAYDATNVATELYNSTQAANNRDAAANAVKFTTPTIASGKVYVGGSNAITVYGETSSAVAPAQTPAFSPGSGSYTGSQTVTISSSTPGASIYYTTDGSAPTTSSTLYGEPVAVGASETVQAVAIAPGFSESAIASAAYTITTAPVGEGAVSFGSGFKSGASLVLNGSAEVLGSRLRLTGADTNEVSSAYAKGKVNVQSFVNDFDFQLTSAVGEGFTFVIQNQGENATGQTAGGLGYGGPSPGGAGGISPSVAVKFDLLSNDGEGTSSTGLYTDGASPTTPSTNLLPAGIKLRTGDQFHVHMGYDGATLTAVITDLKTGASATETYTINIPAIVKGATAYVGFTASTGSQTAIQEIVNWVYAPTPFAAKQITAATRLALNGSAQLASSGLLLTDGQTAEAGSAFFPTTVPVSTFTNTFTFQLTNAVADGFTFTLQGAGVHAVGPGGGGLGYGTNPANPGTPISPSVAVTFDLYDGSGNPASLLGLSTDGASPSLSATDLTASGINLHSGDVFSVGMFYDGVTLSVTVTDVVTKATTTQYYTVDIPGAVGGPYCYAGFTGGTGALTASQEILSWKYE